MSESLAEGERRPARGGLRLEVRRKQRATLVGAAVNLPLGPEFPLYDGWLPA